MILKAVDGFGEAVVWCEYDAALSAGNGFIPVVRKNSEISKGSHMLALEKHANSLGRIFYDLEAMPGSKRSHFDHVGALAIKMDRHNRLRPIGHKRCGSAHVDTKCIRTDFAEYGPRTRE